MNKIISKFKTLSVPDACRLLAQMESIAIEKMAKELTERLTGLGIKAVNLADVMASGFPAIDGNKTLDTVEIETLADGSQGLVIYFSDCEENEWSSFEALKADSGFEVWNTLMTIADKVEKKELSVNAKGEVE